MNENNQKIKELVSKIRKELKFASPLIIQYLTEIEELTFEETEEKKKLYQELGISENKEKKQVVKEVQRLAQLKGVKVDFKEQNDGEIFLPLDQKDKLGNFCPSLVFWTLARELALMDIGGGEISKNPSFWNNFDKELEWVKQNLANEYFSELENLTMPSLFPTEKLEMKELLNIYYPTSENIVDSQISETKVRKEIVDKLWQTIKEKILALVSQELANNPEEEKLKELAFKLTIEGGISEQYTLQINYYSQSPFQNKIRELITTTPLQLENELLKQQNSQLPTPENLEKISKQKQLLENYLQDFTDEEKFKEIKEKINEIN